MAINKRNVDKGGDGIVHEMYAKWQAKTLVGVILGVEGGGVQVNAPRYY